MTLGSFELYFNTALLLLVLSVRILYRAEVQSTAGGRWWKISLAVSLNLVGLPLFAVVRGSSRQKDDINLLLSSTHADMLHRLSNFLLWLKSDGVATCDIT